MAGTANAGEVRARLVLDNSQFRQGVEQARGDMQRLQGSSATASKGMTQLQTASAAVGAAVVAAAGASVAAAANFEQGMAKVKAIGGATGSEFERLKKTALDLGASTSFSATQAADGMALLAAAGFKTNDIIDSMPALLNLASAANLDLATSADYLGSMMSGFGIKATDSGHAVDVLVRAMNDANTDLPDLAEAMKYVAPVAASLKIPFEDTAAAVALMSNAGIKGSQAGTTLRATLLSMANPVGQAAKAMDELGISYKNSNGEMKPLPEILDHVKGKMAGLTDAQKTQYAAMLVGTEASSGFLTLLKEGGGALTSFADNLRNSTGSAQAMADTMKDTLMGDLDNFMGALETLGIKLGSALLPAARELLKIGAGLAQTIGELDPKMLSAGLAAAGAAAGVALLATGVLKAVTAIRTFSLALVANPATAWIAGISLAVGALTGVLVAGRDETEQYKEVSLETYKSLDSQSKSVSKLADDYDAMRGKVHLSNDELLKYQSLQTELERATDPRTKQELQAALDGLVQKSGANNEEIKKTISLSDELIAKSPATQQSFNEKGQAIAHNSDAARELAKQLNATKEAELELQKAQAMKNLAADTEKMRKAVESANESIARQPALTKDVAQSQELVNQRQREYKDAMENGNVVTQKFAKNKLENAQAILADQKKELEGVQQNITTRRAEIKEIEAKRSMGQAIFEQITAEQMAQTGLNYEKGKEIETIEQAIQKENEKIAKLNEIKQAQGGLTEEQQKALEAAQQNVNKYGEVKDKISQNKNEQQNFNLTVDDGTQKMEKLNDAGGKPVEKKFTLQADPEPARAKVEGLNAYVEEGKVKPVDANPLSAMNKILGVDSFAETGKTKPIDANPFSALSKVEGINRAAEESKTKPVDANTLIAQGKISFLDAQALANKTKPVDANTGGAMGKVNNLDAAASASKMKHVDADTSSANAKVNELSRNASKDEHKSIWVSIKETVSRVFGGDEKRHNGGTTQSIRPKYHNGGSPAISSLRPNSPKFDEVDVRLLKNEMVLTAGQQENLFNMIRTFNAGAAMNMVNAAQAAQGGYGGDTIIQVAELHVREEADVEKLAAELDRISKQRSRARGY